LFRRCSAVTSLSTATARRPRSFLLLVDDLIDGLIRLAATSAEVTGPVNLGNPIEFSVLELARMVIDLTASHSRIVHGPRPEHDPKQRRPDIFAR
jgi:UDP-glucuronate decarboxylase